MKIIAWILFCGLICSCTIQKKIYFKTEMKSALGLSSTELMQRIGTPTQVFDNGNNGRVFIYDYGYTVSNTSSTAGQYYQEPQGLATPNYTNGGVNQNYQQYYQPGTSTTVHNKVQKKIEYFINTQDRVFAWHAVGFPMYRVVEYTKKQLAEVDPSLFEIPKEN